MKGLHIAHYPVHFKPYSYGGQVPYPSFYFKITWDNNTKEITWQDDSLSENNEAIELRSLIDKIINIVQNKKEFKKIPKASGMYLWEDRNKERFRFTNREYSIMDKLCNDS